MNLGRFYLHSWHFAFYKFIYMKRKWPADSSSQSSCYQHFWCLTYCQKKSWARKSKSKVEIDQTKPYQSEICHSTFFSVCTFPMPTERYEVWSISRWFVLTFQQLCEWFWTCGGDGECELVHGNAVSYRQGINLPVGHLASQQLPQQDSKTGRRAAETGKVKTLSIYWSISIATHKNPV